MVGAAKAGTTSLHQQLDAHPRIHMSAVKEPHYFSRLHPSAARRPFLPTINDEEAYLRLFRGAGSKPIRGESSTSYLTVPGTAERIRDRCPEAKVVISLREPVARAYSHFLADTRDGVERRSFAEAIEQELSGAESEEWGVGSLYIRIGRYAEAVARYQQVFGPNLQIVFFEELAADPVATMTKVFSFLEMDIEETDDLSDKARNPYREARGRIAAALFTSPTVRRISRRILPRSTRARAKDALTRSASKPPIEVADRARLEALYGPEVQRLAELLDRHPPWPAYQNADGSVIPQR